MLLGAASGKEKGKNLEQQIMIAVVLASLIAWLVSSAQFKETPSPANPFSLSFFVLLFLFILSIFVNIIFYVHSLRERDWASSPGRKVGRVLAVLGGLMVLIGLYMPWGRVDFVDPAFGNVNYSPLDWGGIWIFVAFGVLWFIFFAVPRKVAALWGFVWGCLALINVVVAVAGLEYLVTRQAGSVFLDPGVYVNVSGSVFLIVGSVVAYVKAKNISPLQPIPSDVVVPPTP